MTNEIGQQLAQQIDELVRLGCVARDRDSFLSFGDHLKSDAEEATWKVFDHIARRIELYGELIDLGWPREEAFEAARAPDWLPVVGNQP